MLTVVDVSNRQSSATVRSAIMASAGVVVKATEGRGWFDKTHDATVAKARAAHRLVGHYHYHWPEEDPIVQMRHFLAIAKPRPGDLLALDLERASGTWAHRLTGALSALAYLKATTHASPLLYVNGSWATGLLSAASPAQRAQLTSYPLWIAAWNGRPGSPGVTHWPVWTMHQYADAPATDHDVFNGTASTWARLGVPHPVAYVPKPAPKPAPRPATPPPAPKPAPAPAPLAVTVHTPAVTTATTLTIHLEP